MAAVYEIRATSKVVAIAASPVLHEVLAPTTVVVVEGLAPDEEADAVEKRLETSP